MATSACRTRPPPGRRSDNDHQVIPVDHFLVGHGTEHLGNLLAAKPTNLPDIRRGAKVRLHETIKRLKRHQRPYLI